MRGEATRALPAICCSVIVMSMVAAIVLNDAPASATEPRRTSGEPVFSEVSDTVCDPEDAGLQAGIEALEEVGEAVESPVEPEPAHEEPAAEPACEYEPAGIPCGYGETACEREPADGLTPEGGVNHHGGRTETYYSSQVLYHADTPEWTLDEEGFYRDAEGRYVVAASDMEQGTVFTGSKGECVVLDTGCAAGVTDYYVNW